VPDISSYFIRAMMIEAARTTETTVDNYFTRQYIPEDKSELNTDLLTQMIGQRKDKTTLDTLIGSRVRSGSTVSDYGLDDRGSIPGRGKGFLL
jgi:hypothetical protein